ncbi:MAG: HAD family hydrolase [Erysipelotrichaceae bacterium]|nr:HAD family hydrolase [Erysipelotrichaceae bacterium]
MDNIKAVIFDFDNTLGDRFEYCYQTYRCFVKTFLPEIDENSILFESMLQDLVLYDEYGNVGNKDQILRTFEQKYGVRINMSGKEFARWWIEHQYLFTVLFPDAMDTVLKLKEKYKIGILTNGAHLAQWGKIEKSGLLPYMDAVLVSEDAGFTKPDIRIFQMMADKLGLKCEECVYVGDTFSLDIMGAYNSGMKPVWIWPSERAKPSDFEVTRIRNISDLLEIL